MSAEEDLLKRATPGEHQMAEWVINREDVIAALPRIRAEERERVLQLVEEWDSVIASRVRWLFLKEDED